MVTIATAKLLVIGDAIYFFSCTIIPCYTVGDDILFFCTLIPCYIQYGNCSYRKIVGHW